MLHIVSQVCVDSEVLQIYRRSRPSNVKRLQLAYEHKRITQMTNILDFRPVTYWTTFDEAAEVVNNIEGADRRRVAERYFMKGETPPQWIAAPKLSGEYQQYWGETDPRHLGGEFLPRTRPGEVEIARITLAASTQDVTSIRARKVSNRIAYRVVDEYEEDHRPWSVRRRTSIRPLTLGELVDLIETAELPSQPGWGLVTKLMRSQFECGMDDAELCRYLSFFEITSPFYPHLGSYFDQLIRQYIDELSSPERP
jgi:hypothetical protein